MAPVPKIYVYAPFAPFVLPYVKRRLCFCDVNTPDETYDYAVMVSTTDVYALDEGALVGEDAPVGKSDALSKEEAFRSRCKASGVDSLVLRCAPIVGTGMDGFPRRLVEKVYRGTFYHLEGNDARVSVVHAAGVADAINEAFSAGLSGVYNLTDGDNPTLHDLAEAFACRLGDKRIGTLKPRWYRLLFGKDAMARAQRSLTFSGQAFCDALPGYSPMSVTEYLTTHVYDDESL